MTVTRSERAAPRHLHLGSIALAELTLPLVTVATIAGFARLYDSGRFFVPLLTFGLVGHGLATACRHLRVPAWIVAGIAVASGALLVAWVLFPSTTYAGLPTAETLRHADTAFDAAMNRFRRELAPAPVLDGFQLAAALAIWGAVWFADWSAFRIWATAESVAPAGVLFVFGSLLGAPDHRAWSAAAFVGAVLLFVLCHRTARQELGRRWVSGSAPGGRRWLLGAGALLGVVAIAIGLAIGPQVPGAGAKAMLSWRQRSSGDQSRITVSPLVDIRSRLVDQSDAQAFSVRADRPAYWRLTSLDEFDGQIWSSRGSYALEGSRLEDLDLGSGWGPSDELRQEYSIDGLDTLWMPAAFAPDEVVTTGPTIRADRRSQTLIVDTDRPTSDGLDYAVESDVPAYTAEQLRRTPTSQDGGYIERSHLGLPDDFSDRAAATARQVTADAPTAYDKALALQTYFRSDFTYSLEVDAGHDESAIDAFLESRTGYCEQFAGTFAAMAREVGLPSRVAVGFTPGEQDPDDQTLFRVKGRHAHAWPEVWLGTAGWVAFEPTPGRGAPDAEAWTGVPPQQDAADPLTPTTVPTTVPGAEQTPTTLPELAPPSAAVEAGDADLTEDAAPADRRRRVALGLLVAIAAAALVAWIAVVIAIPLVRRRRQARRARTNADLITVEWDRAVDSVVTLTGSSPRAHETQAELAQRVAPAIAPAGPSLAELARLAAAAAWSGAEPSDEEVQRAAALRRSLDHAAHDQVPVITRIRRRSSLRRALGLPEAERGPRPTVADRWRSVRGRTAS